MKIRFGTEEENIVHKYIGESDPLDHVEYARLYGVQYRKQNGHTYLYIHWTQFQRTGIWNWKCTGDNKMGRVGPEVQNHIYISNMNLHK
jgi:hypothetical protein